MQIGCFLSCEEFGPRDLVEQAKRAEQAGLFYHRRDPRGGRIHPEATDLPVTTGVLRTTASTAATSARRFNRRRHR